MPAQASVLCCHQLLDGGVRVLRNLIERVCRAHTIDHGPGIFVGQTARNTLSEMRLKFERLRSGKLAVDVKGDPVSGVVAPDHVRASFESGLETGTRLVRSCLKADRARANRLITVPMGHPRMDAISL